MAAIPISLSVQSAGAQTVIWEQGDQIVRLIRRADDSAAPNDHPVYTTPDAVAAMLQGLHLRYADEEADVAPVSVFTKEEIDNLSKAVATGLGLAAPSQDLTFHTIGARRLSPGARLRRNRVCAGRIFYRDGNLNIIFGQIQTPHRKKNVYGQVEQDFYPRNYGSRSEETKHEVILLTDSAVELYQSGAGVRDDWVVIHPEAIVAGEPTDDKPDAATADGASAAVSVVGAASVESAPGASSNDAAIIPPEGTSAQPPASDVQRRLQELKRLRDLELISEEAYQAKMKEILQDL